MLFWYTSFAIILIVLGIVACVLDRRRQQSFEEKWPAIDDDEFLRRCSPGTRREIALTVRRIVSKHLCIPYEHIHPEQNFIDDLQAD